MLSVGRCWFIGGRWATTATAVGSSSGTVRRSSIMSRLGERCWPDGIGSAQPIMLLTKAFASTQPNGGGAGDAGDGGGDHETSEPNETSEPTVRRLQKIRDSRRPEVKGARKLERHLPEVESYFERHGVVRPWSHELSKKAQYWMKSIKSGQIVFLAEYKERLERLGLLTHRSKLFVPPGETTEFCPEQYYKPTREEFMEARLLELEAFFEHDEGSESTPPKKLSPQTKTWASKIKKGISHYHPEQAPRLQKLGLLTEKSISKKEKLDEKLEVRRARFRAKCDLYAKLYQANKRKGMPRNLVNWGGHVRVGNTMYDPEYLTLAKSLNIITEKSKPYNL